VSFSFSRPDLSTTDTLERLDRRDLALEMPLSNEISSRIGAETADAFEFLREVALDVPVASERGLIISPK
jgi:thiazole synthase ThiGH ThiG subunit